MCDRDLASLKPAIGYRDLSPSKMTMKAATNKKMEPATTSYPGGKNGAGVYQRLINQIPPHEVYIEPFLGGGAIMKAKLPAPRSNIGSDIDNDVMLGWASWQRTMINKNVTTQLFTWDAMECLSKVLHGRHEYRRIFIYCDPPYIMETRRSGPLYRHEFTEAQHIELLQLLLSLDRGAPGGDIMVMISGYRHAIYDDALKDWRRIDYMAPTRRGAVPESAWMNYPEPQELHDYRYLGKDFRERERIARKIKRWVKRLDNLPTLEKNAILSNIAPRGNPG